MTSLNKAMNWIPWKYRCAVVRISILLAIIFYPLVIAIVLAGCVGTLTPPIAQASAASWDGTNQNSGFISFATNADGKVTGGIITPHARERYKALMRECGHAWLVTSDDAGLTRLPNGTWFIDAQHLAYFAEANDWIRNGKTPHP
jgi:hypothetical protein